MFDEVEQRFDTLLVQHAFSYITGAKAGISSNELEDVLLLWMIRFSLVSIQTGCLSLREFQLL